MPSHEEAAKGFFEQGFNCAQGVLMLFGPSLGLDKETAARLGAAFGGGIFRSGQTCGAVTGALMVLGLKHGNSREDDKPAKENTYVQSGAFAARFKKMHGSIMCRDLLGCDLGQPGALEFARENHLFEKNCPRYVGDAAGILARMLEGR